MRFNSLLKSSTRSMASNTARSISKSKDSSTGTRRPERNRNGFRSSLHQTHRNRHRKSEATLEAPHNQNQLLSRNGQIIDDFFVKVQNVLNIETNAHLRGRQVVNCSLVNCSRIELQFWNHRMHLTLDKPYCGCESELQLMNSYPTLRRYIGLMRMRKSLLLRQPNSCLIIFGSKSILDQLCQSCNQGVLLVSLPIAKKSEWMTNVLQCLPETILSSKIHFESRLESVFLLPKSVEFVLALIEKPRESSQIYRVTFPGGKRLLGESSFACALREFEEECGFSIHQNNYSNDVSPLIQDPLFWAYPLHTSMVNLHSEAAP